MSHENAMPEIAGYSQILPPSPAAVQQAFPSPQHESGGKGAGRRRDSSADGAVIPSPGAGRFSVPPTAANAQRPRAKKETREVAEILFATFTAHTAERCHSARPPQRSEGQNSTRVALPRRRRSLRRSAAAASRAASSAFQVPRPAAARAPGGARQESVPRKA